jgi:hypothetical protein
MSKPVYRVHPSIGVARLGDSPEYYIAPEQAAALPINPGGNDFRPEDFRDRQHRLRRQGARFEILRYGADGSVEPVRPGADGVAQIRWTVHLANKKASWYEFIVNAGSNGYAPNHPLRNRHLCDPADRVALIIDPGPRTLDGPNQSVEFSRTDNPDRYPTTFPPPDLAPGQIDSLGGLRTDDESRLIVLGGFGCSGANRHPPTIGDYANNDGWWDDTSDGPVTATIVLDDGREITVDHPAWAVVAPPRYAPQLLNVVTLYDTMFDIAVRGMNHRPDIYVNGLWQDAFRPRWDRDIRSIIERVRGYQWVAAIPRHAHELDMGKLGDPDRQYRSLRQFYLGLIRPPDAPNLEASADNGLPLMPMLCGDNCFQPGPLGSSFLTVTQTQYFFLTQWAAGKFDAGPAPADGRGAALDRAALENCVGGAFSPGIEITWISRDPRIYSEPLRVRAARDVPTPLSLGADFARGLEPGDLCRYMACPWQADFNECSQEQAGDRFAYWWPVQRPDFVHIEHDGKLAQVPWVGSAVDQNAADYIEFADDIEMVHNWSKLGFVFNTGSPEEPRFIEVQRRLPR